MIEKVTLDHDKLTIEGDSKKTIEADNNLKTLFQVGSLKDIEDYIENK